MGRYNRIFCAEFPYHITARCVNRSWFKLPLEDVWSIMQNQLFALHHFFNVHIHSFVLMPNHFHMLALWLENNMSESMQYFMGQTSRTISGQARRINQTYGARYHSSRIDSLHYYYQAYKYVYYNPVKAGLSLTPQDYPYSTLPGLIGKRKMHIPLESDELLFSDFEGTMRWLNMAPTENNLQSVKKALKRRVFQFGQDRDGHQHFLENALL